MNPVWMVRSRQIASNFRFWLVLTGYNPRDRSLTHKIYLIYASVFWSIWIFAVLAWAASGLASFIQPINPGHTAETAAWIEGFILVGWFLFSIFSASRKSPIVFSEDDAFLICQTPVDRRSVALMWLVGDWPGSGIPFWALSAILGFTLVEVHLGGKATFANISDYLSAAMVGLSILAPLQFGMLSSIWAFGLIRLRGDREVRWLTWIPALLCLGLIAIGFLAGQISPSLNGLDVLANSILSPVFFPIRASFSLAAWLAGWLAALVWVGFSLLWLSHEAVDLNLSRAAQETTQTAAQKSAIVTLNQDAAEEIRLKRRLGTQKPTLTLPPLPGAWSLIWKDGLQSIRSIGLTSGLIWVQLFAAGLGALIAHDWGLILVAMLLWIIFACQAAVIRLNSDLKNWGLFTQLPFKPGRFVLMEIGLPVIAMVILGWAAAGIAGSSLLLPRAIVLAIIPELALITALSAVLDILRRCKSENLMAGIVPGIEVSSVALAGIFITILLGFYGFMNGPQLHSGLIDAVTFAIGIGEVFLLIRLVQRAFRKIR